MKTLLRAAAFLALAAATLGAQVEQAFYAQLTAAGITSAVLTGALNHTLQVNVTGSPATCAIQLEGSLDGVNWANLSGSQSCTAAVTMFHVDLKPVKLVRANLTAYSGGGTVSIFYRGSN